MKRRLATAIAATTMSLGVFGALPTAGAATTESESFGTAQDTETTITVYSAMTDIFSCKYYPTRPWC